MGAITYVAKREIEPTGYLKNGTDISAAAADDSFNSTSTDLTGLSDNQWLLVAGFANAANDGWFQANGNSALHKITQDTTSNLVTEAAGPLIHLTGYKRGYGQSYNLESSFERGERGVKFERSRQQPIGGGAPEVLLHRTEVTHKFLTDILTEGELAQWREFLASVAAGEIFTIDRYGTIASPVEPKQAMLDDDSYDEQRLGGQLYRIGFSARIF
jgi:hypothetical protein